MKKTILTLLALANTSSLALATLLTNDSFTYSDGALTAVSGGTWVAHSGAGNQPIQVVGNRASFGVVSGSAEDDHISLGVTNTTGDLYASFVFNFSSLPTATEYFAHFKDDGTGYRCRIFSTTSGAGVDKFRLGIRDGSSGTITYIATDLDLTTDYKLVARFRGSTNSTIWIEPTSESSAVNRADSVDVPTNPFNGSSAFALRQASGMGTLTLDDLLIGTQFTDVQTIGGPPTIGGVADQHIAANTSTGPLSFLVDDVETPATELVVTGTSDNSTLVPNNPANIALGGSGTNRTVNITPASSQEGLATIELVVTDGNNEKATNSFKVYVGEPTISAVANQIAPTNTVIGPLAFTVNDAETAPGSLTVTPSSDNEAVVPTASISIANLGGQNRTVTITPATDAAGTATVTLTVSDGTWNIPTSFTVTFYPKFGLVLGDDFSYMDGSIVTNSSFFWNTHSGATGQTQVINGRLSLSYTNSEDINAYLTNAPYAAGSGLVFYARLIVNFSELPGSGSSASYFAHFREFSGGNFRARVFATTSDAAPGSYRIGVANGSYTTVFFPQDLSLGLPYVVIVRYNNDTAESTLWVNPASEASPSVTATDPASPITIYNYAFRQSSGIGTLKLDDLKIGTAFSDVWVSVAPPAEPLQYSYTGGTLSLSWTNTAFVLQAAPEVTGTYTNVPGATNPWPVSTTGTQKYFRLKY